MAKGTIRITENELVELVSNCCRLICGSEDGRICSSENFRKYEMQLSEKLGYGEFDKVLSWHKKQKLLYEGLIRSYDSRTLCNALLKKGADFAQIQTKPDVKTELIFTKVPTAIISDCERLSKVTGWDIIENTPDCDSTMLIFAPRFGKDANALVYEECNGILYHVTPCENVERISKQGLVPRSGQKIDKSRDMICLATTEEDAISISYSLSETSKKHYKHYALLKIDLSLRLHQQLKPKFFMDPMYYGGVVTLDNIPPYCVKVIKTFSVE